MLRLHGSIVVLGLALFAVTESMAQGDPNFELRFGQLIEEGIDSHTDTHVIVVRKPVSELTLSMRSSGIAEYGDEHLDGAILLDTSNALVSNLINNSMELSATIRFLTPLPVGEYPATSVTFGYVPGYFHETSGRASGLFADGQPFDVSVYAGFVPEPASGAIALLAAFLGCCVRRSRANC